MKPNIKGIITLISLIVVAIGYLSFTLHPSLTQTVNAESYLAGIIDARPDELAVTGWGNIEARHNVFTSNPIQRVLVKRPYTGIPSGSQITHATLRVYTKDYNTQYCSDTAKRTYGAHKITQDWSPSSLTWRNQPSFASSATATIQKAPKTDVNQWWEFDVTADINSPYGWVLKDETEDAYGFTAWDYIVFIDTAEIYFEYTLPTYTLTVSVKGSDGSPVSGATVRSPFSATTDANGQASSSLTYGDYIVTIYYGGRLYSQIITLDASKTVSFVIPKYTLTIKVADSSGKAVQGASVTSPFTATTDTGGLALSSIPAGSYTVNVEFQGLTYTQNVTLDASKTVSVTVPKYTLTIKTVDPDGKPLAEAVVISPVSDKTDATGTFSTSLTAGQYTVTVAFGAAQKSDTVLLSSDKTVTLTLTPEYTVQFIVKDQVGNPLPAKITFDTASFTCDKTGVTQATITKTQVTVKAEVKVGTQAYSTTEALTLTKSTTKEITITRRFFWKFFINYTDGTLATGTLTATSTNENLTVPVTSGYGEAYLIDATYTFAFSASPAVTLKTASITNDGEFYATINKEAGKTETTTTTEIPTSSATSPTVTPEVPWLLIPSLYIYALLGVLMFGFIIAAAVRLRRPSR
jgi:hypothetical protein